MKKRLVGVTIRGAVWPDRSGAQAAVHATGSAVDCFQTSTSRAHCRKSHRVGGRNLENGRRADRRSRGAVVGSAAPGHRACRHSHLTFERLARWHAGLFPGMGTYRDNSDGPMQVVSGRPAANAFIMTPPAELVPQMMDDFLSYFNAARAVENGLTRAALAHLWLEAIHPFVDGNGRIGRAIVDLALAQDEESADRFYSLSGQIAKERDDYYDALQSAQRGSLDVTEWTRCFLGALERAIDAAEHEVTRARKAANFWEKHNAYQFNARQRQVLWRMLGDFEATSTFAST